MTILLPLSFHCKMLQQMTETCAIAILVSFSFLRLHMWVKFVVASAITAFYCTLVWEFTEGFYEVPNFANSVFVLTQSDFTQDSQTINYMVKPRIAHIMTIVFLTISLHLIDRQTDYMNRLDFQWNEQLVDERKEANIMHKINNILLKNILPVHVGRFNTQKLKWRNYMKCFSRSVPKCEQTIGGVVPRKLQQRRRDVRLDRRLRRRGLAREKAPTGHEPNNR